MASVKALERRLKSESQAQDVFEKTKAEALQVYLRLKSSF
jgi:hypothetical protein